MDAENDLFDKTDNSVDNYTVEVHAQGLFWELTTWMLWVTTACCISFKISGWSQWHPNPSCEITALLSETGGGNTPLTEYTTTTLPLSSISKILPAVWVYKESKGLEKHDEETLEETVQKQRILISLTCRLGWSRTSTLSAGTCALPVHLSTGTSLTEFSIT
jgi:hypothetical protein